MKINTSKAISTFHPNPSYEQVYFEAVANALDAEANRITIDIKIDSFESAETLKLVIEDNGKGFIDKTSTDFLSF
jgi:phosphoglycerate-specific signal transduction histidine kinase